MKREIKFRAWDILYKKMYNYALPTFDGRCNCSDNTNGSFNRFLNDEEYLLMQYTGLKDKNGKEIYEGDILNVYDWGSKSILLSVCKMVWDIDETGWNFEPFIIEDRYDFIKAVQKCEVIGNIYENPELLK